MIYCIQVLGCYNKRWYIQIKSDFRL